jgi:hypothetical protein
MGDPLCQMGLRLSVSLGSTSSGMPMKNTYVCSANGAKGSHGKKVMGQAKALAQLCVQVNTCLDCWTRLESLG